MDSSREGAVKKLNGHGNGLNGHGTGQSDDGAPQPPLSGLVDELAQAMNMARESLDRPQPQPLNPTAPPLPAMAPPRTLFEDEDDDAAMPIPSTWRTPPEPPKTGTLRDQLRAAGFGFATGLAVIVPVVLVMTGRLGDVSFDALFGSSDPITSKVSQSAAIPQRTPERVPVQVQQRTVPTTVVTPRATPDSAPARPTASSPEPTNLAPAAATPPPAAPAEAEAPPSKPSWADTIAEAKDRIQAGDIRGAREMLLPAVAANEPEAIMTLAETYDPNMLAAWGIRDVTADVEQARQLYARALREGVEPARIRLRGLN